MAKCIMVTDAGILCTFIPVLYVFGQHNFQLVSIRVCLMKNVPLICTQRAYAAYWSSEQVLGEVWL